MNYFKGIATKDFVSIFFSILFFIAPGITISWVYFPSYFESFDALKLVLFSVSLITPVVAIVWLVINGTRKEGEKVDDKEAFFTLFSALFSSALFAYIALPLAWLIKGSFGGPEGFKVYIIALSIMTVIGSVIVYFEEKKARK